MSRKLLGAFTNLDPTYPPYTNISVEDGDVIVTVRGPAVPSGKCGLAECRCLPPYDQPGHKAKCPNWTAYPDSGATVEHRMTRADFERLFDDVGVNLGRIS